ncbi:MAG: ATP-binding protein [Candidatus Azotimanducaceae bacterium WSBS_2022_MAG_OTU7]
MDEFASAESLFPRGQIRLEELSVYNWGSFHGLHSATIDSAGTLITGDNGSGKSTFVDGLMALLLPAGKATFNVAAAQGDRSDRSLMSYMRGSFGSAHDGTTTRVRSKREKAVVTGLRALYGEEGGSKVSLAALFWTTQTTNALSDVKRLYIVAKRDLRLKEVLDTFGEGNVRQLKQWLRDDPTITCCDDSFTDYQELYRNLLQMENRNAPALLSRALGLKKIDDLTKLIRELVLEPSTVREDARKAVDEFVDLVAIHDELLDAREQVAHLERLPQLSETLAESTAALSFLQLERDNLAIYFAEQLAILWTTRLADLQAQLDALARSIIAAEQTVEDAVATSEQRHEEYLQLGGNRIEILKKEIENIQSRLDDVVRDSSNYQQDARQLALPDLLSEATLLQNQETATTRLHNIKSEVPAAQDQFAEAAAAQSDAEQQRKKLNEEIQEISSRPGSNVPARFQRLRDEMVESLALDESELVFVAELIDVKEDERAWQGAVERALGGLRTTLLVPDKTYSMVTKWLNVRHIGLHVRVQVCSSSQKSTAVNFREDGFLRKLQWRSHDYRDWLKHHLNRYDLVCVSGTDELDVTPFSMTRQGLVHKEKGRFEKKDQSRIDDRRDWCLGFSNRSRLSLLQSDKQAVSEKLLELEAKVVKTRTDMDNIVDQEKVWTQLLDYNWQRINLPYWQQRQQQASDDLAQLESSKGDLTQAKIRWEQAKSHLKTLQNKKENLVAARGGLESKFSSAEVEQQRSAEAAVSGLTDESRSLLRARVGQVFLDQPEAQAAIEKELDKSLDQYRNSKATAENTANGIMVSYRSKDKWTPIAADWPTGLAGMVDFLEHYRDLEGEGLPSLVEQFRERLNKHTTQSLARIKTKLESEREEILERIDIINSVLARTEFRQGSHLRLGAKREKYPHVQVFNDKLNRALGQVTSDDHESRFNLLSEVVDILDKASAVGTAGNMESLRLLDPRYQMSFFAEELDSATHEVRDVLESSSGKSGGEKEAFAGTIVAASLAYVLTPDGGDRPIYSTVFLDEAFSNTAEAVSRRVLRVFKALHIHVNLITPYKNLNLARESANSLLIAERDAELHESHLCEVTWQEIDERREQQQHLLRTEAESLGVELHG